MSQFLKLRPEFPLENGQSKEGPLRLDSRHWVPERVNTFLRDYQRAGIRFFWDRWKKSKGGLLGDDMGLVRVHCSLYMMKLKSGRHREKQYKLSLSSPPSCGNRAAYTTSLGEESMFPSYKTRTTGRNTALSHPQTLSGPLVSLLPQTA